MFIAREDYWNNRFEKAGLPIIGDDIKSQVGATIVHRALARLFHDRGVKMLRTSQLNVGGNMDFFNMLERERLESKKISKTNAVTSIMGHELPADDVYIGPSDYVPWLTDRKWAHIRVEGQAFGDVPLNLELKLEVWDSPNSAGIVIDAVRCCKLGAQQRHRRPARRPELLPHEVAAHAAPRRPGARGDRGVHRHLRPRRQVRQGCTQGRRQGEDREVLRRALAGKRSTRPTGQVGLFVLSAQARWTICMVRSTMGSGTPDVRLTGVTKRFGETSSRSTASTSTCATASSSRCWGRRAAARRRRCG